MLIDDFEKVTGLIAQLRAIRADIELMSERTGLAVIAEVEGNAKIHFCPDATALLYQPIRSATMSAVWDLLLKELYHRDRAVCRELARLGVEVEPYDMEPIDV